MARARFEEPWTDQFIDEPRGASGPFVLAGAATGLAGAAVMMLFMMVGYWLAGAGLWTPPKLIAALWGGVQALVGGTGTITAGILFHLAVGTLIGALYGACVPPLGPFDGLAWGLAAGAGIAFLMTFAVLPLVDPVMETRVAQLPGVWVLAHVVYGLFLGLVPALGALWTRRSAVRRVRTLGYEPAHAERATDLRAP